MLRKSGTFPQTQVSGAIDKVRVRARLQGNLDSDYAEVGGAAVDAGGCDERLLAAKVAKKIREGR